MNRETSGGYNPNPDGAPNEAPNEEAYAYADEIDVEIAEEISKGDLSRVNQLKYLDLGVAAKLANSEGWDAKDFYGDQVQDIPEGLRVLPLVGLRSLLHSDALILSEFKGEVILPESLRSVAEEAFEHEQKYAQSSKAHEDDWLKDENDDQKAA